MKAFKIIAFVLTIIGGLNWLTIGMLQYDFVAGIFGTQANLFSRIIYTLVGVSSVYVLISTIFNHFVFDFKSKKNTNTEMKKESN